MSQSFMLSLNVTILILCEFSNLFSKMKLKLGHTFSQFNHRFKIWTFKCRSWALYTSKFLPIHKREEKLGFFNISLGCTSKFFHFTKEFKVHMQYFFVRWGGILFQYDMWRKGERNL